MVYNNTIGRMDDCIAKPYGWIIQEYIAQGASSLPDKANWDYTVLIYHIWRYLNIL